MKYQIKKVKHRMVFIPDEELRRHLKSKLKGFRHRGPYARSAISANRKKRGLRNLLSRHRGGRFFIIVDLVHAFHQVTRAMIAQVFPEIAQPGFDLCFAKFGDKEIIPMGFPTSSHLFEVFMAKKIDKALVFWQDKHGGVATRYCDNILLTWDTNTPDVWTVIEYIFDSLDVRFTPGKPRKWSDPIRFCGITIPREGKPRLSKKKKKSMISVALKKLPGSIEGVEQFISQWS